MFPVRLEVVSFPGSFASSDGFDLLETHRYRRSCGPRAHALVGADSAFVGRAADVTLKGRICSDFFRPVRHPALKRPY